MSGERNNLALAEIVTAYLGLAMVHPEKAPKTQRAQRDNDMLVLGYNQAQEALRTILANHGVDDATQALADVRNEKQQRPVAGPGGIKMWVAG